MVNLSSFSVLDLSYNYFSTNSIPSWISSLHSLVSLNLANCDFNGSIPAGLMNMVSLIILGLSNNQLTGTQTMLNSSPGNIYNFWEINSNSISRSIPESLGNLHSLQTLELESKSFLLWMYLPNSLISGLLPDSLGRLLCLVLDISNNEINGTLPQSVGPLTKLMILDIRNNLLTGVVTEDHFANLTSFANLRADANMLRLEISANNWKPPFQLQIVSLNSWSLDPKFPYWLQNQTNLSILYLASTGISDNIPRWFSTMLLSLQHLNLVDNNFSSVSLKDLFCFKIDAEHKQIIYIWIWVILIFQVFFQTAGQPGKP